MGSVGRGENRRRRVWFFTDEKKRRQPKGVEKESAVVVSPDRLQLAEKESGFLERVAEEKGVVFCGQEKDKATEGCEKEAKAEGEGCGRCLVQTRRREGREGRR
ncbi:hypothetical protein OIU78_001177 [Salix suchowensis]|nr:hypothetical protein OIU78_001177 [Salix suchowensis]